MAQPAGWPSSGVVYIDHCVCRDNTVKMPKCSSDFKGPSFSSRDLKRQVGSTVRIRVIEDQLHPAFGQRGLFAKKKLKEGAVILEYVGEISSRVDEDKCDYAVSLVDGYAVDANSRGNEARFINDYRGVPNANRPNAAFELFRDRDSGELRMGVFVADLKGISKGQEILVSYGKSFWRSRNLL
jgi:hypothetical protein